MASSRSFIDLDELREFKDAVDIFPRLSLESGEAAMGSALSFFHGLLPDYPAPPPDSRYVRTGTLGRGWTEKVSVDGWAITGEFGTTVSYAPWVVGPDFPGQNIRGKDMYQAKIHMGRWWQLYSTWDSNEADVWAEFSRVFVNEFVQRFERQLGVG